MENRKFGSRNSITLKKGEPNFWYDVRKDHGGVSIGHGGTVICSNATCGYRRDYFLGHGMMPIYPLTSLIMELHPKTRPVITGAVKNRHVRNYEHNRCLFQCKSCDHVFTRMMVNIEFYDGESFESHKRCSRCRKDQTEEVGVTELENRLCPRCKNSPLMMSNHILWD